MKVKTLFLALAAAALTASVAFAAPPATHPGNGTNPTGNDGKRAPSGTNCKPRIMVVLHGTVAVAPGTSPALPFELQVAVKSANWHGQAFIKATQPLTITVTSSTRIVNHGKAPLSSLLMGDQVTVQARACRADLASGATPSLTARMLIDQHGSSSSDASPESPTTTTTTTTLTTSA